MLCCLFTGCVILVVALLAWIFSTGEGFASKREKAAAIFEWFTLNPVPRYTAYKRDLERKSNIVEYAMALQLKKEGGLTTRAVEAAL